MKFAFHISKTAREKYQFDETVFATDGHVIFADFAAVRLFAEKMSAVRGEIVPASEINAMGLLDEMMHILIRQYEMENPGVMQRALLGSLLNMVKTSLIWACCGLMNIFLRQFPISLREER